MKESTTKLHINELFETIQGEGSWTGTPSIFVRLQGCPVGCSWCDTKHTWSLLPENVRPVDVILKEGSIDNCSGQRETPLYFTSTAQSLFELFKDQAYSAKHIVITGGEPCMYDLTEFTQLAHSKGFTTQIETSGTYAIFCDDKTWVTVSPKINMKAGMPVLSSAMLRANEIKHPVAMQKHIDELKALLQSSGVMASKKVPLIYLQPISQQKRATELAISTCIKHNWRLSIQVHKYIGVE